MLGLLPTQVSGARQGPPGQGPALLWGQAGLQSEEKGRSLCPSGSLPLQPSGRPTLQEGQTVSRTHHTALRLANSQARRLLRSSPRQSHSQRGTFQEDAGEGPGPGSEPQGGHLVMGSQPFPGAPGGRWWISDAAPRLALPTPLSVLPPPKMSCMSTPSVRGNKQSQVRKPAHEHTTRKGQGQPQAGQSSHLGQATVQALPLSLLPRPSGLSLSQL